MMLHAKQSDDGSAIDVWPLRIAGLINSGQCSPLTCQPILLLLIRGLFLQKNLDVVMLLMLIPIEHWLIAFVTVPSVC